MQSKPHFQGLLRAACTALLAIVLAACGGSDDDPPAGAGVSVGAAGGTVDGPNGAQVVVPANALALATVISVTQTADGAPALPAGNVNASAMFALLPHGTSFAVPVTLKIPFDPSLLGAGETPALWKTNAALNGWEEVAGTTVAGNMVQAQISSFSFVVARPALVRPRIDVQPASKEVAEPAAWSFGVGAFSSVNSGFPSFQWKRNGVPIAGANGTTYNTGATSVANDNGAVYSVDVTNRAGTTQSANATLTVTAGINAVAITRQPADRSVAVGADAKFEVEATGTAPEYQWQRFNNGSARFEDIGGANASTYTLTNAQLSDSTSLFRVRVSNANGANPTDSNAATLTVLAAPPAPAGAGRISAGDGFSLAVTAAGSVPYSWGSDAVATLGNGSTTGDQLNAAPLLTIADVKWVSAGHGHGVAVLNDGKVQAWGYSGYVDCGVGVTYSFPVPITVAETTIVAASAGYAHTLLLGKDGKVYSFGCNSWGELGREAPVTPPPRIPGNVVPLAVSGPQSIIAVAAGNGYSLALDGSGNVWAWGKAGVRGDGVNSTGASRWQAQKIADLVGVKAIAAGADHALALRNDDSVVAWGGNSLGQLGVGTNAEHWFPTATLLTAGITAIAAGGNTSLAVRSDGAVLSWGSRALGGGPLAPFSRATPEPVVGLNTAAAVAVGIGHALALRRDGSVAAWGDNSFGQLGDGTLTERFTSVTVTGLDLD